MAEPEKQETQPTDPPPDDPPLTNPQPADADAMEAEGRRSAPPRRQAQEINRQRAKESLAEMVELPGGWMISESPASVDSTPTPPDNPDKTPDIPSTTPAETQSATDTWADKTPDIANAPPAIKPLSPLDSDIIEYLSRVATTATDDEVHRQVNRGQQGRTLAMTRIALHKLVRAGLVDKINGQYRLAGARP